MNENEKDSENKVVVEEEANQIDKTPDEKAAELAKEEALKLEEEKAQKAKQAEEVNREQARRRRENERKQALEKQALETAIKITGGINPYTQEKIEDQADLDELILMKEIEKNGGDPLADFAKYQKQKRKEQGSQNQQVQMTEEKAKEDWADFALKHPAVELDDLMKDERFLDYADGKIGRKPLAQIYDNYLTKFNVPKKEEPPIVKQSPGSLGQGANEPAGIFPKAEYEKLVKNPEALRSLSREDFQKLLKSDEHWAKHK